MTCQKNIEFDEPSSIALEDYYAEVGHGRNICFVWIGGRRLFLNYNYMVSCEYKPDENTITVIFTTNMLILKGVNLENLFYDLMNQLIKQIICIDYRYNIIGKNERFVVNEILLEIDTPKD